jgi:Flp pilus assembly protein TadD
LEALAVLEKAIPLASEPLPLLLERVQLMEKGRDNAASLAVLEELSNQYPEEPAILAPLAKALAANEQPDKAIQTAQRALRGSTALKPADRAALHALLGGLLRQAGQLDQAIHQLSEATRLSPGDLQPYLELGDTHMERRQYAQALQVYQKAVSIAPQDARPFFQAGLALKASRDYESAENMLRRAAELSPDDLTIHRQLAALVALNLVHNRRPLPVER